MCLLCCFQQGDAGGDDKPVSHDDKPVKPRFDPSNYDKDLVQALERDIVQTNPNVKWSALLNCIVYVVNLASCCLYLFILACFYNVRVYSGHHTHVQSTLRPPEVCIVGVKTDFIWVLWVVMIFITHASLQNKLPLSASYIFSHDHSHII